MRAEVGSPSFQRLEGRRKQGPRVLLAGDRDATVGVEPVVEPVPGAAEAPAAAAADARDTPVAVAVDHDGPGEVHVDLADQGLDGLADVLVRNRLGVVLVVYQPLAVLEAQEAAVEAQLHEPALVDLALDVVLVGLQDGRQTQRDGLLGGIVGLDALDAVPVRLDLLERQPLEPRDLDHDLGVGQPEAVPVAADDSRALHDLLRNAAQEVVARFQNELDVLVRAATSVDARAEVDA